MKVRASVRKMCRNCKIVRRKRVVRVRAKSGKKLIFSRGTRKLARFSAPPGQV